MVTGTRPRTLPDKRGSTIIKSNELSKESNKYQW
jgi:hypothetical protein